MKRRTLIHLPIIHTTQDMGNIGNSIHQTAVSVFGSRSTIQKDRLVDQIWAAVEQAVDSLDPLSEKVRLYQDGLPVCGREMEIVADLAEAGSRNHRLLMRLIHKGALLMGTESPALLLDLKNTCRPDSQAGLENIPESYQQMSLREIVQRNTLEVERMVLTRTLKQTGGNKAKATRLLQIDYKTMHTKIKKLGIAV